MTFAKVISNADGQQLLVMRQVSAATGKWEISVSMELPDDKHGRILSQLFQPSKLGGATLEWARAVVAGFDTEAADKLRPGFEQIAQQLLKEV